MIDLIPKLIEAGIEEVPEEFGGPGYRCSVWLKDGTYLPCVFVQKVGRPADRLRKSVGDELSGEGQYDPLTCDPVRQSLKWYLCYPNQIASHLIERIEPSPFAIPISLLAQVTGEVASYVWLFALETASGRRFKFSGQDPSSMIFFELPDEVSFSDFVNVINPNARKSLPRCEATLHERVFFNCYEDDEPPYSADLAALGIE
ncbi:MAG: hypothetical protein ABL932_04255 [Terricaulis sp.]